MTRSVLEFTGRLHCLVLGSGGSWPPTLTVQMLRGCGALRHADSRIEKMCSGPARKSSMALFWIATVEYSEQARCFRVALKMAADQPRRRAQAVPVHGSHHLPVRRWK